MAIHRAIAGVSRASVPCCSVRARHDTGNTSRAGAGHTVFATDTFAPTLGSHSRCLSRHFLTPSPRHAPDKFGAALRAIVEEQRIDWLIPTCEEV